MDLRRFWHHILMSPLKARRAFPGSAMDNIAREVTAGERGHRGEVRLVVEAELTTAQLWADLRARERAIELFSQLRLWDTEDNTGILIYVLLADRKVEIVADRGIARKVGQPEWDAICASMGAAFARGDFERGAIVGVQAASLLLDRHFPAGGGENPNELPDKPLLI
jgi:uncharacterized membrane protein